MIPGQLTVEQVIALIEAEKDSAGKKNCPSGKKQKGGAS